MSFSVRNAHFSTGQAIFAQDIELLTSAVQGNGVLSGCEITAQGIPDMTVHVATGTVWGIATSYGPLPASDQTITTADALYPRLDLITTDGNGHVTVTAGTPDAVPLPPNLPADHIALALVYVQAATTAIQTTDIIDKRVVLGGRKSFGTDPGGPVPLVQVQGLNPTLGLITIRGTMDMITAAAVNDQATLVFMSSHSSGYTSAVLSDTVTSTSPPRTQTDLVAHEFSLTETWNDAGHVFTGLRVAVTNTASNAASLLLNGTVGGASKITVDPAGNLVLSGGIKCVLPTSAGATGTLWNDSGTVKIS